MYESGGDRMPVSQPKIEQLSDSFIIKNRPQLMTLKARKSNIKELKRYFQITDRCLFEAQYPIVDIVDVLNAAENGRLVRARLEKTYAHYELEPYDLIVCIKSTRQSGEMVLWAGQPSGKFAEKVKAEGKGDWADNPRFVLPAWRFVIFRFKKHVNALKAFYYFNHTSKGVDIVKSLIGSDKNRTLDWQGLKKVRLPIDLLESAPARIEAKRLLRDLSYQLEDLDSQLDALEDYEQANEEADFAIQILRQIKRHLSKMEKSPPPD